MVIPKASKNYREISGKTAAFTIASALVAIKVLWVAIRQRPFDLNSGDGDFFLQLKAFSRKIL